MNIRGLSLKCLCDYCRKLPKITISIFKINRFMPYFWYLSNVSLKILSYFYKPKNMAIWTICGHFGTKKEQKQLKFSGFCSNWQRYKDSNLKWRSQSHAMLHTKCPFQARFKALVSLKCLCEFFSNLLPLNIRFYYYELQCKSYMSYSLEHIQGIISTRDL